MPKLYSARVIVAALRRSGFSIISQRGSHIKLKKKVGSFTYSTVVPNHKEIARGTFASILELAHLTEEEFEKFVK